MRKLLLLFALTVLPLAVSADEIIIGAQHYELDDVRKTAILTNVESSEDDVDVDIVLPTYVEYEGTSYRVTEIDQFAFHHFCFTNKLVSVILPQHLMILNGELWNCAGLTSITIPKSITKIGQNVFWECNGLTSMTMKRSKPFLVSEDFFPDRQNAVLYVPRGSENAYAAADYWKDFKEIRGTVEPSDAFFEFDDSGFKNLCVDKWDQNGDGEFDKSEAANVTSIGDAFKSANTNDLEILQYFTGLTSIDAEAFMWNGSVQAIILPPNIQTIGERAFKNCSSLESITFPDGLQSIGEQAFYECSNLKSLVFPETMSSIEKEAFTRCYKISNVIIPDNVTTIGEEAFYSCESLKTVTIGKNVNSIGVYAFGYCPIANLTLRMDDPSQLTVRQYAFDGYAYDYEGAISNDVQIYVPRGTMKKYKSSEDWGYNEKIEEFWESEPNEGDIFWAESAEGVYLLYKVTNVAEKTCQIGDGNEESTAVMLSRMQHGYLDMLPIPSSVKGYTVTAIADYAFNRNEWNCLCKYGYSWLRILGYLLPSSITYIGERGLGDVTTVKSKIREPFETNAFNGYSGWPRTLFIPYGSKDQYMETTSWKEFSRFIELYDDPDLFPDCPEGEVREAAMYLYPLGIVQGEGGLLLPNREVTRSEVAKTTFYGVYNGVNNVPEVIPPDNYPSVYDDLDNEDSYYYRAAKALLYLEYNDDRTPFDRDRLNFEPLEKISRINYLKMLLEAFNIYTYPTSENPFPNDPDAVAMAASNHVRMGYLKAAADMGIINTDNELFRPYDKCTRGEAFLMLARTMWYYVENEGYNIPSEWDYFQPLNTTMKTIALDVGLQMGNFQHYAKTSFDLKGAVSLTFMHTYNSYNTTLPGIFFGDRSSTSEDDSYQPLGDGWSHNYHSFITVVGKYDSSASGNGLRAIVHWGGGTIHAYLWNGQKFLPESMGVYDEFVREGKDVVITTKQQIKYRFSDLSKEGAAVLYLTSITDRNGNTLTINYEDGHSNSKRISSVGDGNRSLLFSYLPETDCLASVKDPLNREIGFSYFWNDWTGKYQLQSFTDAEGNITTYDYAEHYSYDNYDHSSKLLSRIQLPKGNYIENEYDHNRRLKQTVSGLNGVPTTKTSIAVQTDYDNIYGNGLTTISDVNIQQSSTVTSTYHYEYNENNVLKHMYTPEFFSITNTYGNSDHPELPTQIGMGNYGEIQDVMYDDKGNVKSYKAYILGEGITTTTKMEYDDMNNLTKYTDANGNETRYIYDGKGNLTEIQAPEGVTTKITIGDKGLPSEVMNAENISTKFEYNKYGNLIKTIYPSLNLFSSADYDDASRLVKAADALTRTTSYDYNKNDQLTNLTDAMNHVTKYAYDANGNLTGITNAKAGVTSMTYDDTSDWLASVEFQGSKRQYEYNQDGTVSRLTKPDGTTLEYTYDGLGRMTNDGITTFTYSDVDLQDVTANGKTLTLWNGSFSRLMGYHYNGNTYYFSRDNNGNLKSIYDDSYRYWVQYDYDGLNRMTGVFSFGGNIRYTYRKDSKLSKVEYDNVMTTEYGYDAAGRLTSKTTKLSDGTVVAGYTFKLDNVGNIVEQTAQEPYSDLTLTGDDVSYTYNDANRITHAGDINFEFDANGNTTKRGDEEYTWNAYDQLTKAGNSEITYDPLGNIESYGDIAFTVSPLGMGNVMNDSRSGAQYYYGNGLEARVLDGKVSYYVTDLRGSVVAIVDEEGNITHKYQYDEFGNVTQKEEADYNPFQYVGKHGVMALNDHLYYMRARHYDPTIGRFLSEDPIWSTNLYPYAENNPIMGIDPEGLKTSESNANNYTIVELYGCYYTYALIPNFLYSKQKYAVYLNGVQVSVDSLTKQDKNKIKDRYNEISTTKQLVDNCNGIMELNRFANTCNNWDWNANKCAD